MDTYSFVIFLPEAVKIRGTEMSLCSLLYGALCFSYLKSLIGDKWRDLKWSWLWVRCNDCRSELARQIRVNWARETAPSTGSIDAPQTSWNKVGGKVVFSRATLEYIYVWAYLSICLPRGLTEKCC